MRLSEPSHLIGGMVMGLDTRRWGPGPVVATLALVALSTGAAWMGLMGGSMAATSCQCIERAATLRLLSQAPAPTRVIDCATAGPDAELLIPRVLHTIYLGGSLPEKYLPAIQSCRLHHSKRAGWRHVLWNDSAALAFVERHDPDFAQSFRAYKPVQRSDVLRYYLMKHLGGLYLDTDQDCWRDGSDMLAGYHVVLQGYPPGQALCNGMLASVPGHPLWDVALGLVKERRGSPTIKGSTGPEVMRDAYLRLFNTSLGESGLVPNVSSVAGTCVRVHQQGTWFNPCGHREALCALDLMLQRAVGAAVLTHVVGMHRYEASWKSKGASTGASIHPNTPQAFKESLCAAGDEAL